ncbi:MAG: ATP-binding protein [Methylocystis sp.]
MASNLPLDEWTVVFGNQRPAGALLDRLTGHVHILDANGESYRLKQSLARSAVPNPLIARHGDANASFDAGHAGRDGSLGNRLPCGWRDGQGRSRRGRRLFGPEPRSDLSRRQRGRDGPGSASRRLDRNGRGFSGSGLGRREAGCICSGRSP